MHRLVCAGIGLLWFVFCSFPVFAVDEPELAPVVVEDSRESKAERENPTAKVLVAKPHHERAGESTQRLLERQANIEVLETSDEAHLATVRLRGGESNSVAVFIDGIPINDPFTGVADLSMIPVSLVDRIDIHFTVAPLLLSSDVLSGSVNIVTAHKQGAWASLRFGSFSTVSGAAAIKTAQTALFAAFARSRGDFTFKNDNGTPRNSRDDFEDVRRNNDSKSGWLFAEHKERFKLGTYKGDARAAVFAVWRELGTPGLEHDQAEFARYRSKFLLGFAEAVLRSSRCQVVWRASLNSSRGEFVDPEAELSLYPGKFELDSNKFDTRLLLTWNPATWLKHEVLAGITSIQAASKAKTAYFATVDTFRRHTGFLGTEFRLVWPWGVGLASFRASTGTAEGIDAISTWSARIGATVRLWSGRLKLKTQASRTTRMPTLFELFGNRGAIKGNPALKPEQAWTFEAGVLLRLNKILRRLRLKAEFHTFITLAEDLILMIQNSQRTVLPMNIGAAQIGGEELSIQLALLDIFALNAAYTHLLAIDTSQNPPYDKKLLPGRPEHEVKTTISMKSQYAEVYWGIQWRSKNFRDRANLVEIEPQTYITAGITVYIRDGVMLNFECLNLTGAQRYDTTGYPLPGRQFFVSATIEEDKIF